MCLTFKIFQIDSPSYPPPHARHRARSLPVPNGMTPTLGSWVNVTLSEINTVMKYYNFNF